MKKTMMLSVIMPTYNEKNTLLTILEKVRRVPIRKEIIIIDDGSVDGTQNILDQFRQEKDVKVVFHERNRGKGAAIRTGLGFATGDMIVIQDADLEYDPRDYLKLVPLIESGKAAVVYGSRILGRNDPSYFRYYWGGRLLTLVANLLFGLKLTDEATCYKVFRKEVLCKIKLDCTGFEFCPEVTAKVARLGYGIVEIPISYDPRSFEEGKKIRWRDGVIAIWTLLKYRFLPLEKIVNSHPGPDGEATK